MTQFRSSNSDLYLRINGQNIYSKMGKGNERATSSFSHISETIDKVLKNSPCLCVYVILELVNKGKRIS